LSSAEAEAGKGRGEQRSYDESRERFERHHTVEELVVVVVISLVVSTG